MQYFTTFSAVLLSATAILTSSAKADASLAELQARLEKAQKENLQLKTEKLERENLTIKAEALEQENAKLRAEMGKGKPVSFVQSTSIVAARVKVGPSHVVGPLADDAAASPRRAVNQALGAMPKNDARREMTARAERVVNEALDNIPRNDPRREMTAAAHVVPVSTVLPVVQQWGGVYAGINAGYGKGDFSTTTIQLSSNGLIANDGGQNIDGPVVGGQIGYNYQFSNRVIAGVEADMDYADVRISGYPNANTTYISTSAGSSSGFNYNISARTGINWLGTVRARLGYAIGNFMPYFTGGLAYGNTSIDSSYTSASSQYYGPPNSTAQTNNYGTVASSTFGNVQAGWAAGAGAEFKVADSWALKGEYLYTSIGGLPTTSTSYSYSSQTFNGTTSSNQTPSLVTSSMGSIGVHQARIGLNYYTGWGASSPTVSAKY